MLDEIRQFGSGKRNAIELFLTHRTCANWCLKLKNLEEMFLFRKQNDNDDPKIKIEKTLRNLYTTTYKDIHLHALSALSEHTLCSEEHAIISPMKTQTPKGFMGHIAPI